MIAQIHSLEHSILSHVNRYRLATRDSLSATICTKDSSEDEIDQAIAFLRERDQLREAIIYGDISYYYQTRGYDSKPCQPFSEPAKFRAYAMLAFCTLTNTPKLKLTNDECQSMGEIPKPSGSYYRTRDEANRLGFVRIDVSYRGRWDRIVSKFLEDIRRHQWVPQILELIEWSQFEFSLVTTTPQKAKRIQDVLSKRDELAGIPIRVTAMPELLNFFATQT